MKEYYDARAAEYDEWYLGHGRFASLERPQWSDAVDALQEAIGALAPARTLDVACGTGFLTCRIPGEVTGLDQSERMLEIACRRCPDGVFVEGDALELPFANDQFERVFTAHFYGHLQAPERELFLSEARRVARELVVVDSAVRPDHEREEWQQRVLNDGSRFSVFKRYFEGPELARELGERSTVLHESPWFVVVSSTAAP